MGELKKISDYSDSSMHWTPREALEEVLSELDDPNKEFDGVLIIKVRRDCGTFDLARAVSKLRTTEIVAACEIIKSRDLDSLK